MKDWRSAIASCREMVLRHLRSSSCRQSLCVGTLGGELALHRAEVEVGTRGRQRVLSSDFVQIETLRESVRAPRTYFERIFAVFMGYGTNAGNLDVFAGLIRGKGLRQRSHFLCNRSPIFYRRPSSSPLETRLRIAGVVVRFRDQPAAASPLRRGIGTG